MYEPTEGAFVMAAAARQKQILVHGLLVHVIHHVTLYVNGVLAIKIGYRARTFMRSFHTDVWTPLVQKVPDGSDETPSGNDENVINQPTIEQKSIKLCNNSFIERAKHQVCNKHAA